MSPVKWDESYPVTAAAEEKQPHELLAGTACPEFLLSEHFMMSKEQKKQRRKGGVSQHIGQVVHELRSPTSWKSASIPAKSAWEEITLFFLIILFYGWNKSNRQFNLICMLCGGSGSGHQEDSASPWQAGDLQMGACPSFHCSSSWIWT